jgi:hypothetical protein
MDFARVSAVVSLCADVFRIHHGSSGTVWRPSWRSDGDLASFAMPSFSDGRIRSGDQGYFGQALSFAQNANEWDTHISLRVVLSNFKKMMSY